LTIALPLLADAGSALAGVLGLGVLGALGVPADPALEPALVAAPVSAGATAATSVDAVATALAN
jgi:hypothetical protein